MRRIELLQGLPGLEPPSLPDDGQAQSGERPAVDEDQALGIARGLSRRGVPCRLSRATPRDYALLVPLRDGQQAVWDRRRDMLEARVLRDDGTVIGFVPLRVGFDATADDVAGMLAQQGYELVSRTAAPAASRRRTRQIIVLAAIVLLTMFLLRLLARQV